MYSEKSEFDAIDAWSHY
jgi:hypothetical protein